MNPVRACCLLLLAMLLSPSAASAQEQQQQGQDSAISGSHIVRQGMHHNLRPVKIYVYTHPPHIPHWPSRDAHWEQRRMEELVRSSIHYTANGAEADYFWIPMFRCIYNMTAVLDVFHYIRTQHPYWNATHGRHILVTTFDLGPGHMFGQSTLDDPNVPDDINPASPRRSVIFMHFNGLREGPDTGAKKCWTCFQKGKDIMLPKYQGTCGPLCGFTRAAMLAKSPWSPTANATTLDGPRKHLLFYGGRIGDTKRDDYTGRGGIYALYRNHTDYLIVNSAAPDFATTDFAEAMRTSEFCYSPLGTKGGPTDRYMPAVMLGCIPVLLTHGREGQPFARPYDEIIPWQLFSVGIAMHELEELDAQLRMMLPHVAEMRRHMSRHLHKLLYTSMYGSYFGEPPERDAMHQLMRILGRRMRSAGGRSRPASVQQVAARAHDRVGVGMVAGPEVT